MRGGAKVKIINNTPIITTTQFVIVGDRWQLHLDLLVLYLIQKLKPEEI